MFAERPIHAGEMVAVVGGTPMSQSEFDTYRASETRWNAHQIGEDQHLVDLIQSPDKVAGSLNHACDSNLWMSGEVTIAARRDIAAGEELTLDYALTTVDPTWLLDQSCACGTAACRHTITGNDWRLPEVQARYAGHFVPFINERIRRLRGS